MSNSYRFMYLRNGYEPGFKGAPFGCVAIQISGNRITYQVSVCNPADEFDRAQARQLALGRLVEKPFEISLIGKKHTMHDITRTVMYAIERNKSVPQRARKAATEWIDSLGTYDYFMLTDRYEENESSEL